MHISSPYTCVVPKFQTYLLTQCIPFRGRGNCSRRLFEICVPLQIPSQRRSDANSAANPIAYAGYDRSASSGGRLFGSSVLLRRTSPIVYNLRLHRFTSRPDAPLGHIAVSSHDQLHIFADMFWLFSSRSLRRFYVFRDERFGLRCSFFVFIALLLCLGILYAIFWQSIRRKPMQGYWWNNSSEIFYNSKVLSLLMHQLTRLRNIPFLIHLYIQQYTTRWFSLQQISS